ncbi:Y-family DNA polymerase [Haploplasma axanthum]|uniref:DNA polymerase IV n=1 Tax=Haploplasma axanthum TaxID=29552 RepID=A0A449BDK2_HAPAX|nr:Y-family DNA polymerase [Haploplasma axanthum]VEU80526.1 DNA polymerase IV [Haploplasma axanthum]
MEEYKLHKNILCIDLKSFYASVECAFRNLDPFETPLVVADRSRGDAAICLATTPYLRNLGVKNRGRIFEIPENLREKVIYARPQMKLYMEYTLKIIEIYLEFISEEDLYVYSIDEAFLDVTNYLSYYKMTDIELAKKIVDRIHNDLGLYASCGVGPNMLMSKLALDIDSKKEKDSIAKWTYDDIESKLWPVTPISKMWGIGRQMEKNLNKLGLITIGDIANYNINLLKSRFGVIGEELWYHTHGIDMSILQEKDMLRNKNKSIGNTQVLFHDYYSPEIYTIILEMADEITRRLRLSKKKCKVMHFGMRYSKDFGSFHKQVSFDQPTSNFKDIYHACIKVFDNLYDGTSPIKGVSISLSSLVVTSIYQFDMFEDFEEIEKERKLLESLDKVKLRYGKNAINRASSLSEASTIIERNKLIGGHHE